MAASGGGGSGGRLLKADIYCALDVTDTGAAGVYLDKEKHYCAYYRRPLPRLADDYSHDEAEVSNMAAGVRHWEEDWEEEDLDVIVFSDSALVEPLSPYRLANLFGPQPIGFVTPQFASMALGGGGDDLRDELRSLARKHDITLQYVVGDVSSMSYNYVHSKDRRALDTGAALLGVASWLAQHVHADVEEIEDRLVVAVGDGRELEIELNRGTNVPENCLFEF